MALGFELAARAIKEGIKIRRSSWDVTSYVEWWETAQTFKNGDHALDISHFELIENDWELFNERDSTISRILKREYLYCKKLMRDQGEFPEVFLALEAFLHTVYLISKKELEEK